MNDARSGTGAGAPTVLRMILGRRLQEARQSAGLSLDDAAKTLRVTPLTIRRLEKAEVGLRILYVEKLLETYGAAGRRSTSSSPWPSGPTSPAGGTRTGM